MERLHILDECVLPLLSLKNKIESLFIPTHWQGGEGRQGSCMNWVHDKFQDRNISLHPFPRITYDI